MQGIRRVGTVENRTYYDVKDVMRIFGTSKDKAYRMIRATRESLIDQGMLVDDYPRGKVPKVAFNSRYMCG